MIQEITISGHSEISIRPLIESAIQSELRSLNLAIKRTEYCLISLEKKYNMSSDEFKKCFKTGELNESLDFIEWFGEVKTLHLLNTQKQALTEVHFAD